MRIIPGALIVGALLFGSLPALAALNPQQREELNGYVQQLRAEKDPAALQGALMTWAALADRKAIPELEPFKAHESPRVRIAAGLALMRLGDKKAEAFVLEQLAATTDLQAMLRDVLAPLPDKSEAALLIKLRKQASPEQRPQIDRYLGAQRGELFKLLAADLVAKDAPTRQAAREAAVAARNAGLLTELPAMLKSKDDQVRLEAVQLAQLMSAQQAHLVECTKQLEAALADKSPVVKEAAARALTGLHHAGGAMALIEFARATEDEARKVELLGLVEAQARYGVKPTLASVQPLLDKKQPAPVRVLAYQLAALSGDDKIAEQLVQMFTGTDFEDRLLAAPALGYTRRAEIAPRLEGALVEGDVRIRLGAARGLGLIGQESSIKPMEQALTKERDPQVLRALVASLGQIKVARALQVLRFQTSSQDPAFKIAIIDALVSLGNPEGKASLEVLMKDRAEDVRWAAWIALVKLVPQEGMKARKAMLANPPANFVDGIASLEPAVRAELLKELLSHAQPRVGGGALAFLFMTRTDNAALLRDALTSPTVPERIKRNILDQLAGELTLEDATTLERVVRGGAGAPELMRQAAWQLARLGDKTLEASYRGLLGSADATVKAAGAYGLLLSQGG